MKDRGLTLIELVVAMAIFALVAVMGLQALTGTLRARDQLTDIADQTSELTYALALMRNDLAAVVPVPFFPPDGEVESSMTYDGAIQRLSMSVGGQARLNGTQTDGLYRVEWWVDSRSKSLLRRTWPTLTPANTRVVAPEVTVLKGVTGLRLRTSTQSSGWVEGALGAILEASTQAEVESDSNQTEQTSSFASTLASGLEVTIVTEAFGDLVLIESTK